MRVAVLPPLGVEMYPDSTGVAISPDGTTVVFLVGGVTRSGTQLWVRSLDSTTSRRLEDADGATLPFWSPDSHRIGFFSDGKLKTIAPSGGRAEVLCDAPAARGGAWSPSNVIVFAPTARARFFACRPPAARRRRDDARRVARRRADIASRCSCPTAITSCSSRCPARPAGSMSSRARSTGPSRTFVGSLESAPVYAAPGWLLYGRQGVLNAQRFDATTADDRRRSRSRSPTSQRASSTRPSTSRPAGDVNLDYGHARVFLVVVNEHAGDMVRRGGRSTGTLDLPPGHYETVRISPDGSRAIFGRSTTPSDSALWLVDLQRESAVPFVAERGRNDTPVWSPDGKQVVFISDREGAQAIYVKTVDDNSRRTTARAYTRFRSTPRTTGRRTASGSSSRC